MYSRKIRKRIEKWLKKPELIIIYGARQTGKTTLLKMLLNNRTDSLLLNCEMPNVATLLESKDISALTALFSGKKIIAFDEAQVIPNIGKLLKLIYDEMPEFKIVATGSSSFDLASRLGEPLTGRNIKFRLFPLSIEEIKEKNGWLWVLNQLNTLLVFGSYPGIIDINTTDKIEKLYTLSSDYLYKDIFAYERIKNPAIIRNLLKALALQVGSQVSTNELSRLLGISRQLVNMYLEILERNFIIFSLESFSTNMRNEIKKSKKYFFYDNGILNATIGSFNLIHQRTDTGKLWENFCISERIKFNQNGNRFTNHYFWRTYDGAEIDLIEETNGALKAYEFKFGKKKNRHIPKSFSSKYGVNNLTLITPENLHLLITE